MRIIVRNNILFLLISLAILITSLLLCGKIRRFWGSQHLMRMERSRTNSFLVTIILWYYHSPRISKWFHVDGSMASNIQSLDSLWSKMVSALHVEMDSSERESQRSGVYHSSGSYGWKYLAFRSLELFHSNWLIWMTISEFIPWLWFLEQLFVWGSIHYIRVIMTFLRIILTIY